MLAIRGSAALSPFRIAKLLTRLRVHGPAITGVAAAYVHFVDLERPLAADECERLETLLTYGPREAGIAEAGAGTWRTLTLPPVAAPFAPILYSVPAQLLAYHTAIAKGTDVDQPRNLAKSVTVE